MERCNLCLDNLTHVFHDTDSYEEAICAYTELLSLPKVLRFGMLYCPNIGALKSWLGRS